MTSRPRRRDDRGFVAVWTIAITSTIFMVIGFTLDAGRIVRAKSDAFGTAAAAARAGVQQIDERAAILEGRLALLEDEAVAAAVDHAAQRGYSATAQVDGLQVTVTVTGEVDPVMLGVGNVAIETTATAQAVQVTP